MIDSLSDPPNEASEAVPGIARVLLVLAVATALLLLACSTGAPTSDASSAGPGAGSPPQPAGSAASDEARSATEADTDAPAAGSPARSADATQTDGAESERDGTGSEAEGKAEAEGDASGDESEPERTEKDPDRPDRIVLDTVYDDARVGEDQTPLIEAELGLVEDEALNAYVRRVAIRLLRHAPPRPFDYTFKIVDQQVPNAFALPGGKIYVSRGLLALATSEDELAGVIGHEIIHAAERHAAARIDYSRRLNPFTIGFLRAAAIAEYGRNQELDADRGGQILAARAGYDPRAIATFLRKLDATERLEVGWARIPTYFATHPTSPQRTAQIADRATHLEWTPAPPVAASQEEGYYGVIDGLVLGDNPAGGLFDDENRFVHPDLRFQIRFPQGWSTMNSAQAVRAVSPTRDAQLELTVVPGDDPELEDVVDRFLEEEFEGMRVRVRERREIRIGEEPALRIEGRVSSPFGALSFQMTFVRYRGLVYRMTLLTLSGVESRYRGRALTFARSFRPLDREGIYSLRVIRLRIARARAGETLQALSERTRNELELVYTAVLNGLYASSTLDRMTPIKIGIAEPYIPEGATPPGDEAEEANGGAPGGEDEAADDEAAGATKAAR